MNVHDYFKMYDELGIDHTLSALEKFKMCEEAWKESHGEGKLRNLNTFLSCRTRYIKKKISLLRTKR
jgi:hypothetical protein